MKKTLIFLLTAFFFSGLALARVGVGVNVGVIEVEDHLKAGMIYDFPPFTVINTGDESSRYETTIAYHQDQPELRPDATWFTFIPDKFDLDPGAGQLVKVRVNLPLKTVPGDYFAYLEAHPLQEVTKGNTSIGIAAASKLYFTITPSNAFIGVYYKLLGFYIMYLPWSKRVSIAVCVFFVWLVLKRFIHIDIGVKKNDKEEILKIEDSNE